MVKQENGTQPGREMRLHNEDLRTGRKEVRQPMGTELEGEPEDLVVIERPLSHVTGK